MGRPKGSKNKKTLEKEQKFHLVDTKTTPTKVEWKPSIPAPTKDSKQAEEDLNNLKQASTPFIEEKTDFVQYPNQTNKHADNEQNYLSKLDKKQLDKLKECKKCHGKILADPYRVDTNLIAGLVSTHREHPRYIDLCSKCARELSDLIDNWLGEDYPTKWEDHSNGY